MKNIDLDAILNFNGISDNSLRIILDAVFPVGRVVSFINSVDPNTVMKGQVWKKLPGGYHPLTTDNNSPNMSLTDPRNHIPGEAAQGGLPNIVGSVDPVLMSKWNSSVDVSGAFLGTAKLSGSGVNYQAQAGGDNHGWGKGVLQINASKYSDRYGIYQQSCGQKVIGDHIAMVMWYREA